MTEKKNFWSNFTNILVRFLILAIVILFLFNIGRSIWKNHDIKKQIGELENSIDDLNNEKLNLENRILYYQTATFKELEARRHLGYQKKGEKLVILIKKETENKENESPSSIIQEQSQTSTDDRQNWQKWWNYIFG